MVKRTQLAIGVFILLSVMGSIYYLNPGDVAYSCEDNEETVVGICFKLSGVNAEGTQTRCYYNESAPTRYKNCKSGWNEYKEEIIGIEVYDKVYFDDTKKVQINNNGEEIANIRLLTPLDNRVGMGYQRVAEYEINSKKALKILVSSIETFDKNNGMNEVSRDIDLKYLTYEEVLVNDYDTSCQLEVAMNGSINNCPDIVIGSHYETKPFWNDLDKSDFTNDEIIIVGLYTDVKKGDKIEWVPTFEINNNGKIRVEEWATWTEDLNSGLISYYKFDETSGTTPQDSYGTNHLTTNATVNAVGKIERAIEYTNTNNLYTKGNSFPFSSTGSLSWWFNSDDVGNGNTIFDEQNTGGIHAQIFGGKVYAAVDNGAFLISSSSPSTGTWYHIVMTWDGTNERLYFNGVNQANLSGGSDTATANLIIGASRAGINPFDGEIDEVGIWGRALNVSEVQQLYNGGDVMTYVATIDKCEFSGYVLDEETNPINAANITIWNQYNVTEYYNTTSDATGYWAYNVTNSTNTYMAGAYINNTLIGQLKPYISGTC